MRFKRTKVVGRDHAARLILGLGIASSIALQPLLPSMADEAGSGDKLAQAESAANPIDAPGSLQDMAHLCFRTSKRLGDRKRPFYRCGRAPAEYPKQPTHRVCQS